MPETGDTRAEPCRSYVDGERLLMRIRSTKPEFWRSERIASVDWEDRLVLKGLESYVDDNGVGKDDVELIIGDVFPRDAIREGSRTLARVSAALTRLSRAGLLHRYEVDGARYLYLSFWESFQRIDKATRGRFPRPDGTSDYGDSQIGAPLASPREPSRGLAPGTEEQRNRGTEAVTTFIEQSSTERPMSSELMIIDETAPPAERTRPGYSAAFEDFWGTYPRRQGKGDAFKAWQQAIRSATAGEIIAGAVRYRDDPNREQQFTQHPGRWLRAHGWEDEPLPSRRPESQQDRLAASAARMFRDLNSQTKGA